MGGTRRQKLTSRWVHRGSRQFRGKGTPCVIGYLRTLRAANRPRNQCEGEREGCSRCRGHSPRGSSSPSVQRQAGCPLQSRALRRSTPGGGVVTTRPFARRDGCVAPDGFPRKGPHRHPLGLYDDELCRAAGVADAYRRPTNRNKPLRLHEEMSVVCLHCSRKFAVQFTPTPKRAMFSDWCCKE